MKLADVGVWLAAVWGRHVYHPIAADWFGRETDDIVFCRVTQMGLLRLGARPVSDADTATGLLPDPGSEEHGTLDP